MCEGSWTNDSRHKNTKDEEELTHQKERDINQCNYNKHQYNTELAANMASWLAIVDYREKWPLKFLRIYLAN